MSQLPKRSILRAFSPTKTGQWSCYPNIFGVALRLRSVAIGPSSLWSRSNVRERGDRRKWPWLGSQQLVAILQLASLVDSFKATRIGVVDTEITLQS